MDDKNNTLKPRAGSLKPLIIAVVFLAIAWIIGKGALALISFTKHV